MNLTEECEDSVVSRTTGGNNLLVPSSSLEYETEEFSEQPPTIYKSSKTMMRRIVQDENRLRKAFNANNKFMHQSLHGEQKAP